MPKQYDPAKAAEHAAQFTPKEKPRAQGEQRQYAPSQFVLDKVDSLAFKSELKEIIGYDIDEAKANTKVYGILESIATGNFTLVPVKLRIDKKKALIKQIVDGSRGKEGFDEKSLRAKLEDIIPAMGFDSGFYTMRVWQSPSSGRWGYELHEAKLGFALDEDGNPVKKEDGSEKRTWDADPLSETTSLLYHGKPLSKDQMDHLRLTGSTGVPFADKSYDDSEINIILLQDEYNNREVIPFNVNYIKSQLQSKLGDKNSFYLDEKVWVINKEDGSLAVAASGGYIWVTNAKDKTEKINVWFDPRTRKFRPTIAGNPSLDYSMARNKEARVSNQKAQEAAAQAQSKGKGRTAGK